MKKWWATLLSAFFMTLLIASIAVPILAGYRGKGIDLRPNPPANQVEY